MAYLKAALALMFAAGLAMYPEECAAAARVAMNTWATSVAPALLPFASVMPFLTCNEVRRLYGMIAGRAVKMLFGLPGGTAPAIIVGLMSGSPAGAMAVRRVAAAEGLTKAQTARLACIACGVSPVYVVSVLGAALNGSRRFGWCLAASQLAAQIGAGVIFRNVNGKDRMQMQFQADESVDRPVAAAVNAALRVCGYMVLFTVGIELGRIVLGDGVYKAAVFIDLPTGARFCGNNVLLAAALGTGGVCIAAQNLAVLRGIVSAFSYIGYKMVVSVLCVVLFLVLSGGVDWNIGVNPEADRLDFERNLLLTALFILPAAVVFLEKRFKKHIS